MSVFSDVYVGENLSFLYAHNQVLKLYFSNNIYFLFSYMYLILGDTSYCMGFKVHVVSFINLDRFIDLFKYNLLKM